MRFVQFRDRDSSDEAATLAWLRAQPSPGGTIAEDATVARAYAIQHVDAKALDGVIDGSTLAPTDTASPVTVPAFILAAGVFPAFPPAHEERARAHAPGRACQRVAARRTASTTSSSTARSICARSATEPARELARPVRDRAELLAHLGSPARSSGSPTSTGSIESCSSDSASSASATASTASSSRERALCETPGAGRLGERSRRQPVALCEARVGALRAPVGVLDRPEQRRLHRVGAVIVEQVVGGAEARERAGERLDGRGKVVEQLLARVRGQVGHDFEGRALAPADIGRTPDVRAMSRA